MNLQLQSHHHHRPKSNWCERDESVFWYCWYYYTWLRSLNEYASLLVMYNLASAFRLLHSIWKFKQYTGHALVINLRWWIPVMTEIYIWDYYEKWTSHFSSGEVLQDAKKTVKGAHTEIHGVTLSLSLFWGERDLMDLPAFYARRVLSLNTLAV